MLESDRSNYSEHCRVRVAKILNRLWRGGGISHFVVGGLGDELTQSTDIDIWVRDDQFRSAIQLLIASGHLLIVSARENDYGGLTLHVAETSCCAHGTTIVDIHCSLVPFGLTWREGIRLPAVSEDGEAIPKSASASFVHYLIKYSWRGRLGEKAVHRRLESYFLASPVAAEEALSRVVGRRLAAAVCSSAFRNSIDGTHISVLERQLYNRTSRCGLWRLNDWVGRARRVLNPGGPLIVLLGPDGAGKSAVVAALQERAPIWFMGLKVFHLFPTAGNEVRPGPARPAQDPRGSAARGSVVSTFQLLLWVVRTWAGYVRNVATARSRDWPVVMDRYFHDVLVDSERYRNSAPSTVRRALARLVPQPDRIIALVGEAEVFHARKPELGVDEVSRQVAKLRSLAAYVPNVVCVRADVPLEDVVNAVQGEILAASSERVMRQRRWERIRP